MRNILRVVLGLIAAVVAGYVALYPPDLIKKNPDLSVGLFAAIAVALILIEVSFERHSRRAKQVHYLTSQPQLRTPLRGRKDELEQLARLLNSSSQILVVVGEPGVGKTALVSDLVTGHAKRYGFVAWQTLYDAPSMREVVNGWLRLLDESTPDVSINSRVDFFLSESRRLRPKQALVVFDNAESIFKLDAPDGRAVPPDEFIWLLLRLVNSRDPKFTIIVTSSIDLEPTHFLGRVSKLQFMTLRGLSLTSLRLVVADRLGENTADDEVLALAAGNPSAAILLADLHARVDLSRDDHKTAGRGLEKIVATHLRTLDREQYAVMGFLSVVRSPMSVEEIQNSLISIGYLRGTVRNSVIELASRHLIDEVQQGRKFAIPIAAEAIVESVVSELITLVTRGDFEHAKLLRMIPLDHSRWSDSMRNNSRRLVFSVAAYRIHQETGQEISQLSRDKINHLFEAVKPSIGSDDLLGTNLLGFLLSQGTDLTGMVLPNIALTGIDFSRSHLFDVDFRQSSLIDCTFADRIGSVYAVSFMGKDRLLVGLASGSVELRSAGNLSRITRCEAHSEPVRAVMYIPEVDRIVSGGEDGRLNVYDSSSLDVLASWRLHECWIWRLLPVGSGDYVLSVASDGSIGVTDMRTLKVIGRATVPSRRLWDACAINGTVYLASEDGVLWYGEIAQVLRAVEDRTMPKWTVAANVDDPIKACCSIGKSVVFGCRNGRVFRLDTHTGTTRLLSIEDGSIRDLCAGSKHGTVFSVGDAGIARAYDIGTGDLLSEYITQSSRTWSIDIDSNGAAICGGDDRSLRLWDTLTTTPIRSNYGNGQTLRSIDWFGNELMLACADDFLRIGTVSEDAINLRPWLTLRPGRRILGAVSLVDEQWACGFEDGEIYVGGRLGVRKKIKAHSSSIESIARNATADRFATGSEDRQIKIFDPDGNIVVEPRRLHSSRIWALDFSPSGDKLVSAGGDFIVATWDTHSGSIIWSGVGHSNLVLAARWLDETRVVSAGTDGTMRLWVGGNCTAVVPVGCVVRYLATDGKGIMYGVGRRSESLPGWVVVRWDVENGRLLQKEVGISGGSARAAIFSKGKLLIGGDLPFLVEIDPDSLELCSQSRIPGPYSGMRLRSDRIAGTDLESVELLGADLL